MAARAKSILTIWADLTIGANPKAEDWSTVLGPFGFPEKYVETAIRSYPETAVAFAVNDWLAAAGVEPTVYWHLSRMNLALGSGTLLGAIGVQLCYAVVGQMLFCFSCGCLYPPKKRPRAGQNHFCESCGKKEAHRFNQRAYERRRKEALARGETE